MKSEPSAVEIPVITLTLTLMCFSLDRPAWNTGRVMWHYKCLCIKLSLQVILLSSCVLVHFFSLFSTFFRDTVNVIIFAAFMCSVCCVNRTTSYWLCKWWCRRARCTVTVAAVNLCSQLTIHFRIISSSFYCSDLTSPHCHPCPTQNLLVLINLSAHLSNTHCFDLPELQF